MYLNAFCCICAKNGDLKKGMCHPVPCNDAVIEEKAICT